MKTSKESQIFGTFISRLTRVMHLSQGALIYYFGYTETDRSGRAYRRKTLLSRTHLIGYKSTIRAPDVPFVRTRFPAKELLYDKDKIKIE